MARVIAVCSGKGGVGKTTAAANIGAALAAMGKKTVLVDMDLGLRNLDVVLGMETLVYYHLEDVTSGRCTLEEALIGKEDYPGLSLLPAAQNMEGKNVSGEDIRKLFDMLRERFDYVLADCPAGIGPYFADVIRNSDEGLVVTSPVISSVRDADKVLHIMESAGVRKRYVLVNGIRDELVKKGYMIPAEEIADILGAELIGVIRDENEVIRFCNEGKALIGSKTEAGAAYGRIGSRVNGETVPFPKPKKKRRGLFR